MAIDPLHRRRARYFALTIGAILALLGVSAAPGSASADAERQGAQLLQSVQAGEQKCQQLSRDQFEAIGEYVMGRMLGSTARHEAMDQQIRTTTGPSGEAQAHVFMGRRFTGCATGVAPAAFGSMMGMMGNYSGASGGGMGNGRGGGNGFGPGMMGGSGSRAGGDNGWSSDHMGDGWGWLVIVAVVVMMGGMGWMMWSMMRGAGSNGRGSSEDPVEVLKARYARGELTTEEFQERLRTIEDARR